MAISLNVYLVTNGNGREAVEFYKEAFGAEVLAMQTFGKAHPARIIRFHQKPKTGLCMHLCKSAARC